MGTASRVLRPALGYLLALLLLLGVGLISYRSLTQLVKEEAWVDHTHEVMSRLDRHLSLLQDAETGQRGHLLTADTAFLAPLRAARYAAAANHRALVRLTADNSTQQQRADSLRQLTTHHFALLDAGLADFGRIRAVELAQLRRSKVVMDKARAVVNRLHKAEEELLVRRRAQSQRSVQRTMGLIGGLTLLALLLTALSSALLHHTRRVQRAAQAEADESRARFRQLIESIPNMAWTTRPDGTPDYYNQQWYDYTGRAEADPAGINWQDHVHPDDVAATQAAWRHALATGEPLTSLRNRWRRAADGQFRWHLVRAVPLRDEATGAICLWVGTNTDFHAQQLHQLQLERVNADLDTFMYTASHDLRTPIHNLDGLLAALRVEVNPFTQATLLGMMQHSVDRFKGTLDHLTDVAKLQAMDELPLAEIDVAALVDDVRLDLQPLLTATGGQLHLDVAACPQLAFAEQHLRSLVFNLLSNALKYRHPDRVPAVWLRTYPALDEGSRAAVLEVEDNGLGLTLGPAQERKLFGLFQRLHNHVEGSGMGLYMVKKIVENAGGRVEVTSQLGQGTIFRLHLPIPQPVELAEL
jgi:PAS domain S-box-containing protein